MRTAAKARGSVTIELAFTLIFLFSMLGCLVYLGVVFHTYQRACKATHDGARYLASVERADVMNEARITEHVALARAIVTQELGTPPAGMYAQAVTVSCDDAGCAGFSLPGMMKVTIQISFRNLPLEGFLVYLDLSNISFTAQTAMPYIGT